MNVGSQEIAFYVFAADNGSPRAQTSTATVTVAIEDTNDSPPRIFSVSGCNDLGSAYAGGYYECRIAESDSPRERFMAHITPIDPDEEPPSLSIPVRAGGSRGPRALFSLEDASPGMQTMACSVGVVKAQAAGGSGSGSGGRGSGSGNAMFYVTADGSLYANGSLDREKCTSYMLRVRLRDLELPHLESSALFRIVVEDVNDHAPVFLLPNASEPSRALRVSYQQQAGSIVGRVLATDADDGVNAQLSYRLLSLSSSSSLKSEQPLLGVQPERGMLYVLSSLESQLGAMLQMRLEACDRGRPDPLCTRELLFVHVLNIPPSANALEPTPLEVGVGDATENLKVVQERNDEMKVLLVLAAGLFSVAFLLAVGVILMCSRRHIFGSSHLRGNKGILMYIF